MASTLYLVTLGRKENARGGCVKALLHHSIEQICTQSKSISVLLFNSEKNYKMEQKSCVVIPKLCFRIYKLKTLT